VWRIFGGLVALLDFVLIITVTILAAQGSVDIYRATLLRKPFLLLYLTFSLFGL
jgi:hypothetical protein